MPPSLTPRVRKLYEDWLQEHDFKSRPSQVEMMTFIESIINHRRAKIGVIEAATGTGKTVAYLATAISLAQEQNKKLIVATATVTLQEQIVQQDLPSLRRVTEFGFTFTLAKGRQRYVCPLRLGQVAQPNISSTLLRTLDEDANPSTPPIKQYEQLFETFVTNQWNGDRDNAPLNLKDEQWTRIITDSRGCMGRNCKLFSQCPYYLSRQNIREADVIVTNYDHLLRSLQTDADIYPPLCDVILICDEAHHLPSKVQSAFTSSFALNESRTTLTNLQKSLDGLRRERDDDHVFARAFNVFSETCHGLFMNLAQLKDYLREFFQGKTEHAQEYRFAYGTISNEMRELSAQIAYHYGRLETEVDAVSAELKKIVENLERARAPQGLIESLNEFSTARFQINEAVQLFEVYAHDESKNTCARWISRTLDELHPEWNLHNVPIALENILSPLVWDNVHAVLCTSATLDAGDEFQHFIESSGLKAKVPSTRRLKSPFNLSEAVSLHIPNMHTLLSGAEQTRTSHTREVVRMLPSVLKKHRSGLVLFASWKTMMDVYDQLPPSVQSCCLVQTGTGVPVLLNKHRQRVDQGQSSYLFGVASLREGIDLPGDYCRHVVITKLPFDVPGDPIMTSLQELLIDQGVEPWELFPLVQLPPMILKLKQACGRLIRNESDFGQITILDIRVVKKNYGGDILNSLPNYEIVTDLQLPKGYSPISKLN